jgi:hypothetical protein
MQENKYDGRESYLVPAKIPRTEGKQQNHNIVLA